jgi:hypothetical protein
MGLREIYGAGGDDVTGWEFVGKKLRELYIENENEKLRRAAAQKRDDLYAGEGDQYLTTLVETAFKDELTKQLRSDLISWAKWNRFIGRVVREKATVYSEPTTRKVSARNEQYQDFLRRVRMDATMREVNRKLVLHEETWVQYRVRVTPRGREPVIDVISPAKFWAVSSPKDPTMLVAIIIDQRAVVSAIAPDLEAPSYRVLVDDETYMLNGRGEVIVSTVETWPIKRMAGVLASLIPPAAKGTLLAKCPNSDVVAAHEAIWFVNLLGLKEIKSANKQTYVQGDISAATMGQSADTERETIVPEGTNVQAVDRGMDTNQFGQMSTRIGDEAGSNHGLPPSVLHQQDASSGAEIFLRTLPIRALRQEHVPIMREVETELFVIQNLVNAVDLPEDVYTEKGRSIDFGEVQQPMTVLERNQNFQLERGLFLTNTVAEIADRNRDMTVDDAKKQLKENIDLETERVKDTKGFQEVSGSPGATPDQLAGAPPQGSQSQPPPNVKPGASK